MGEGRGGGSRNAPRCNGKLNRIFILTEVNNLQLVKRWIAERMSRVDLRSFACFSFCRDIGCESRQITFVLHDALINGRMTLTERSWKITNKMAGFGVSC